MVAASAFVDHALELKMKLLFKARSALVSPWSPTGMSKCRLETVRSSRGPAHSGNRMCFAVTFSRSRNYTTKTQIRWCDFTQQQPLCGACNHCLYFPMSVCRSPRSVLFFFLPLAATAVNVCLKQTFFPEHRRLSPHSGWCTALHLCMSQWVLFIISGSALDQETGGRLRMRLHSFISLSCRGTRPPCPLDESWLTPLA